MASRKEEKERRRRDSLERESAGKKSQRRRQQLFGAAAVATIALVVVAAVLLSASGNNENGHRSKSASEDSGSAPEHVHGLGVNPRDGALFIATHTGLFRSAKNERKATRVGESEQDVMGFSVVGPNRFLGSGHPDPSDSDSPPNLGLIESDDGGQSWQQISLAGEADFHVLRAIGKKVYGFNGLSGALMVSSDGGGSWEDREPPGPLFDLAINPKDSRRVVASTDQELVASDNEGGSWRPLGQDAVGLLAWANARRLYLIDTEGGVSVSKDTGRSWREQVGSIGGQPVAFVADRNDLYAALADATVKRSSDGGATWTVRSTT